MRSLQEIKPNGKGNPFNKSGKRFSFRGFCGCDVVAIYEGQVVKNLDAFKYKLKKNNEGTIKFRQVVLDNEEVLPEEGVIRFFYRDEDNNCGIMSFQLKKFLWKKSGINMDNVLTMMTSKYKCIQLEPFHIIPKEEFEQLKPYPVHTDSNLIVMSAASAQ